MSNGFSAYFDIQVAAENALILYAKGAELPRQNRLIVRLCNSLKSESPVWIKDLVPAYASLLLVYDLSLTDHFAVNNFLKQFLMEDEECQQDNKLIRLPVCYGLGQPNDLKQVAERIAKSEQEVVDMHCQREYRIFAIGFAPGFAYLGELPKALQLPRLDTPRKRVFAGAVAIAAEQTAVYPIESPGGWHILGSCPLPLFNATSQPHMPFSVGYRVQFYPIDNKQYKQIKAESADA